MNMEERYVESLRGRTYYYISRPTSSESTLVFLHGLTADHRLFDKQIPYFSERYTVITWDAPCHGKSRPYSDFTYEHTADELKLIFDTEGIKSALLVGQSMGGFVAQSFVCKYPEAADGILTIGTCPYGTRYYSKSDFFWLRQIEWMAGLYTDKLLRSEMAKICGRTESARKNMLNMLSPYSKRELCRLMYLGFAGFIPEVHDMEYPCPVVITYGEFDRTGKVRKYCNEWNKHEGFPLHIIKNAAHNANDDNPEQVNALIDEFAASLYGDSRSRQ